jgi:rhodanese-related sulfurtransferase
MEQLIEFVGNHPILVGALLVVSALLIHNLIAGDGGKGAVDPAGATELINHQDAAVVDVRPATDYRQGHIINALNIPMSGFSEQIGRLEKYKNRPLIISCRSGAQSSAAVRQLRKRGFDQVYNLRGGILAWQSANLPVSRKG